MGWVRGYESGGGGEKRYSYCWRDKDGRQREKRNFSSETRAKRWGDREAALTPAQPERAVHHLAPARSEDADPLFRAFALDWWETHGSDTSRRADSTRELMAQHLRDYLLPTSMLGGRRLSEIDEACLMRFASALGKVEKTRDTLGRPRRMSALSNATKNRILALARLILRSAKRQRGKWPHEVDWSRVMFDESEDAEDVDLSDERLGLLLDCVPDRGDARDYFYCQAVLGTRVSELLAARAISCDFKANVLKVRRQQRRTRRRQENVRAERAYQAGTKKPKWKSMRDIHMGPAAPVLKRLAKRHPNGPLFVDAEGKPFDKDAIRGLWDRTKAEAVRRLTSEERTDEAEAVQAVKVHWLRHRFAVEALRRGASLTFLLEQMGHTERTVTLRYGKHDRSRRPPEPDRLTPPKKHTA